MATGVLSRQGPDDPALPAPEDITNAFVALAEEACTRHGEVVEVVAPA